MNMVCFKHNQQTESNSTRVPDHIASDTHALSIIIFRSEPIFAPALLLLLMKDEHFAQQPLQHHQHNQLNHRFYIKSCDHLVWYLRLSYRRDNDDYNCVCFVIMVVLSQLIFATTLYNMLLEY